MMSRTMRRGHHRCPSGVLALCAAFFATLAPLAPGRGAGEPPLRRAVIGVPDKSWREVAQAAAAAWDDAPVVEWRADGGLEGLFTRLAELSPDAVLVVVPPSYIDANSCFEFLERATRLDDDPFVDFTYGFITGRDTEAARAFLASALRLSKLKKGVHRRIIDNLGPNSQAPGKGVYPWPGRRWTDFARPTFEAQVFSHGREGWDPARTSMLAGAGLLHFGGHGEPGGVTDGLRAEMLAKLRLDGCVVFNGACSTAVTCRAYDTSTGVVQVREYPPQELFALRLLEQGAGAYLAAVHPDHGIPVYQEMETMLTTGASCGEVMKSTYDTVVLGAGGKTLRCPRLRAGEPNPLRTPKDIMLYGTASRVLFGDPLARPVRRPVDAPLRIRSRKRGDRLVIDVQLVDPRVAYSLQDTFHSDLGAPGIFNDRVAICAPLPRGWSAIGDLEVVSARNADREELEHRMQGWAVESWRGQARVHVQIDFPATAYQQSALRQQGTRVTLRATRAEKEH